MWPYALHFMILASFNLVAGYQLTKIQTLTNGQYYSVSRADQDQRVIEMPIIISYALQLYCMCFYNYYNDLEFQEVSKEYTLWR